MRQLTVQIDDVEMVQLEALARQHHIDLGQLSRAQLLLLCAHLDGADAASNLGVRQNRGVYAPASGADALGPAERERRRQALMQLQAMWAAGRHGEAGHGMDAVVLQKNERAAWRQV